jgi:F0F1-type ATP synthase assembly protein I
VDDARRGDFQKYLRRSTGSYELVVSSVLLALVGFGIDNLLGTLPWFTVAFAVFGFSGASVRIYYGYKTEREMHEAGAPWRTQ